MHMDLVLRFDYGRHAHRARLGLLVAAGLLFLPWAVYWGLLIP
jgi:hypothetical protein